MVMGSCVRRSPSRVKSSTTVETMPSASLMSTVTTLTTVLATRDMSAMDILVWLKVSFSCKFSMQHFD